LPGRKNNNRTISDRTGGMAEPTTRERIYAEQVHQLYRLSRSAYLGTLITSSILVFALWGIISSALLGAWLCAMYALTGARYLLYRDFMAMSPPAEETRKWAKRFVMGAGATGVLWGVAGSVLYPVSSLPHQFLVIFLVGGMSLSATVILAPVQQAFLAYMLPAMSLVTATVFAQGTPLHLFMGALMIVFLGVMLAIAPVLSEMMRDALRVKFDNSALVEQLSRANRELSERIASQSRTEEELRQTTQQVEALIDASPVSIIARDRNFRIVKWNAAAERTFGWTEREVLGKPVPFVPPELEDEARVLRERLQGGESIDDVETVRVRKNGARIIINLSTTVVRDGAGQPIGFFSLATDITEKKRAERRLQMGHTVTRLLAESRSIEEALPQVLRTVCEGGGWAYGQRWALNRAANLLHCAETWSAADPRLEEFQAFNRSRMQTPGNGRSLIHRVWETNGPVWLDDLEQETQMQRGPMALKAGLHSAFALPILVGDGFYGVMEFFGREVRRPDHELMEIVRTIGSQVGQFMARKAAEQNLRFVASHDPLTGLFNRSMFNERLQQALAQATRFERSLALLFIDLDGFKVVNDTLGHNAGDQLLSELATRLRATLREGDVIGRMGGDEFVVLIEEFGDAAQVAEVAKKVLETVSRSFQLQGRDFEVTASVGVSLYPGDGKDAQTLLKNADIAMYLVKQQGKNSFRFYAPQMNVHLIERLSLESSLRRALERGELFLLYQPRVGMREGQVSGVEALLRWQHPTQGMINPAEFIPVAEDAGLMSAMWEWVIHTACRQMRAWRDQGLPLLRMAVNLSPRQLSQDSLIQVVREALHRYGMDPGRMELELREDMVLRNPERAFRLLTQFKELGVHLVIDDFGTGYSSLNYLKRLPIGMVKIDRSLIRELPRDADSAALSRAVVAMAHSLGIAVTAEGVETREQWEFLHQAGCDEMQGNYFSAPVAPEIVASIVRQPAAAGQRASVQPLRPRRADNGADFQ
jgi:diguanylate cyclase (GGDEF)-like protein/PAS domain S-box-containing protein